MTNSEQTRPATPDEDISILYKRVARLNDKVSALLDPQWGTKHHILPEGHPLRVETDAKEQGAPVDWQAIAQQRERELKTVGEARHRAETERDCAYRERAQLLAWLAAIHPAVRTLAPDIDEPGWQILYINPTTGGQMSWHIAPGDIELFDHVEYVRASSGDQRALWDGHTTETKYQRISELTSFLADVAEATGDAPDAMPDDEPFDSDSDVLALISEIASRLSDATDEGEYHAVGLISDLANGVSTVADAREQLAAITFRHV